MIKKWITSNHGQSMVELALILPLVLLVIMGVIQLVLIGNARQTVNYAAFMGVRAAIVETSSKSFPPLLNLNNYEIVARLVLASISSHKAGEFPSEVIDKFIDQAKPFLNPEESRSLDDYINRISYTFVKGNTEVIVEEGVPWRIKPGDPVTVHVYYRFKLIMPVVDKFFDGIDGIMDGQVLLESRCTLLKEAPAEV
jgi:hypothetical protein